jgi:phenylacetate-CoA ligase
VVYRLKRKLLVTPEVEVLGYGDLPRTERKSKRVFDNRIEDSVI